MKLPTTAFVKTGLKAGTEYKFRVQARNAIGYSSYSDELVVMAGVPPYQPLKPLIKINEKALSIDW